ncbi:hypothetical protein VN97_g8618 [Penicillium thymicola]|uniref:Uncharacterized protein n=1 Tax=Penicillium thymicola TaxID=293382 RepID=A0AAI9TCX1_PENTH|nr:hypothetical protein VN97_g8618 [Penicillium thymicola]
MILFITQSDTYDHRVWKIGLPVRSAVLKPHAGELVVGWVTTSESSLLYVFVLFFMLLVEYDPLSSLGGKRSFQGLIMETLDNRQFDS